MRVRFLWFFKNWFKINWNLYYCVNFLLECAGVCWINISFTSPPPRLRTYLYFIRVITHRIIICHAQHKPTGKLSNWLPCIIMYYIIFWNSWWNSVIHSDDKSERALLASAVPDCWTKSAVASWCILCTLHIIIYYEYNINTIII